MGYYDDNEDIAAERQSARDRYLDLLTKQRLNEQLMTNKMRREVEEKERIQAESGAQTGAAKGAQAGAAFGPWGMLAGGILGHTAGGKASYDYRRKQGQGRLTAGLDAWLNPIEEMKGWGNVLSGKAGGFEAGVAGANTAKQMYDKQKADDMYAGLLAQREAGEAQTPTYSGLEASSLESAVNSDPMTPEETADWYGESEKLGVLDEELMRAGKYGR